MLVFEVLPTGFHAGENGFAGATLEKRANYGNILFPRTDSVPVNRFRKQ